MTSNRITIAFSLLTIVAGCVSASAVAVRLKRLNAFFLNPDDIEAVPIACSAEKPAVRLGENVVLRAWAKSFPGHKLSYTWTVTVGNVAGSGREVTWILKGVDAGIYTAEASLSGSPGLPSACSVHVAVIEPERGGEVSHETGRSFLVKGHKEGEGYGLYSYLLLGSPPTEGTRERYVRTLEAYLHFIDVSKFEEDAYARRKLNITYLPLEVPVKENVDVAWLIEHYDYAKARILLNTLPGDRKQGIYFVSCSKPLSDGASPPYLVQNLSAVPTSPHDLISWWVDEFLRQAGQQQFWETNAAKQLALRMRTTVAVLAEGLPEVQRSINDWIIWIHK